MRNAALRAKGLELGKQIVDSYKFKYADQPILGYNPWLVKSYAKRLESIAGVMLHATRAGSSDPHYDDALGTANWARSAQNGNAEQNWGSSWDLIIARANGLRLVMTEYDKQYPSWGAGYGNNGTWAASMYYVQLELAQTTYDQPYTGVQVESCAEICALLSIVCDFPLVRIPFLHQTGPAPKGICTHEHSANGVKIVKSDPGHLWPWDDFLEQAKSIKNEMLGGIAPMTPDERAEFDQMKKRLDTLAKVTLENAVRAKYEPERFDDETKALFPVGAVEGEWYVMTGAKALEFASRRGFSFALGLVNTQNALWDHVENHPVGEVIPGHVHEFEIIQKD